MVLNVQLILFGMTMLSFGYCLVKRQWDYVPLSVIGFSSDESKLNLSFRAQRVGRDDYAVSGTCHVNYDSDETTMVEMSVYISESGSEDDYNRVPFGIDKERLVKVNKIFYKDLLLKNAQNCSNLPPAELALKSPFPRGLYTFDRCTAGDEGVPNIIPAGYYKVVLSISGEVDWNIKVYAKVTTKRIF